MSVQRTAAHAKSLIQKLGKLLNSLQLLDRSKRTTDVAAPCAPSAAWRHDAMRPRALVAALRASTSLVGAAAPVCGVEAMSVSFSDNSNMQMST